MRILLAAALVFTTALAYAQQIDYKGFPEWSWGKQDSTEYYLYTPSETAGTAQRLPIILFLHGCCGEDYHATLRNAVDPPVRFWHNFGKNSQSVPTYIMSPKTKQGWSQHFANIKRVIDKLIAEGKVDPQRIYISGFSMGAQGTWNFIEAHPGYFAAAVTMGMDFKGKDMAIFRNIPIWAIRGDQDWWARHLGSQIRAIRALSFENADSLEWHTGLNPRLTNFEGMGHGVMWPAVSQLELKQWIYSKINDGNNYPMVTIRRPSWQQDFNPGELVEIHFDALDSDGKIVRSEILVNGRPLWTSKSERSFRWPAVEGDNKIEVKVFDDKGKTAIAEVIVSVNIPASIQTVELPLLQVGKYFTHTITGKGNGVLTFSADALPVGISLSSVGILSGVPTMQGEFKTIIRAVDEQGDRVETMLPMKIGKKDSEAVVLTNVRDYKGDTLPVSIVAEGVSPHLRGDDEVTFSGDLANYEGMLLINTSPSDTVLARPYYLQFDVDEDVTVYVAYEKLETLFTSGVPAWLKTFRKERHALTTQYYYYDVYSKDFPKGKISLPDADEKRNGVNNNYFVMVRKKQKP